MEFEKARVIKPAHPEVAAGIAECHARLGPPALRGDQAQASLQIEQAAKIRQQLQRMVVIRFEQQGDHATAQ